MTPSKLKIPFVDGDIAHTVAWPHRNTIFMKHEVKLVAGRGNLRTDLEFLIRHQPVIQFLGLNKDAHGHESRVPDYRAPDKPASVPPAPVVDGQYDKSDQPSNHEQAGHSPGVYLGAAARKNNDKGYGSERQQAATTTLRKRLPLFAHALPPDVESIPPPVAVAAGALPLDQPTRLLPQSLAG